MKNNTVRKISRLAALLLFVSLAAAAPAFSASAEAADSQPAVSYSDTVSEADLPDSASQSFDAGSDLPEQEDAAAGTVIAEEQTEPLMEDAVEESAAEDGWVTQDGRSVYFSDGVQVYGAVHADGQTYYASNGYFEPVSGWAVIDGHSYYFDNGIAAVGQRTINGGLYFFGTDGVLCEYEGWVELFDERTGASERYYFADNAAAVGLRTVDGSVYYFDDQGRLSSRSGWMTFTDSISGSERKCYLQDGAALTGMQTIGSEIWCFTDNGLLADGWCETPDGRCYVEDGRICTGFKKIGSEIYYLGSNGIFMDLNGWVQIDGGRYYLYGGRAYTGFTDVEGVRYYLDEDYNGRVIRGLVSVDGALYYAASDGSLQSGLEYISGKYYYFGSDYAAVTGWKTVDSSTYYFGSDKYALTGWFQTGGYYYYGGEYGAILTDCTVDGYKLDSQGRRQVASGLEGRVMQIIASCTNDSMSQIEKLKACYKWVINNCSYKRDYADPNKLAAGWTSKYALEMLNGRKGNCYRYAGAVAYLAEGLGYDAAVVTGKITAYGGGMTAHGWAEVIIDGKTYIFDANMDDSKNKFICFQKTYGNFPYKITKQKKYDVSF